MVIIGGTFRNMKEVFMANEVFLILFQNRIKPFKRLCQIVSVSGKTMINFLPINPSKYLVPFVFSVKADAFQFLIFLVQVAHTISVDTRWRLAQCVPPVYV